VSDPEEREFERCEAHDAAMLEVELNEQLADEYDELDRVWLSRSVDQMPWPTKILITPVTPKCAK